MNNARRFAAMLAMILVPGALASGCGDAGFELEVTRSALSICGETVPTNRFIDGIPAYAQCATAENAAIYSNNGVDTSLTSGGADWIRTQGSGGYQCTELAHRYLHFRWGVTNWLPRGNAGSWCDTQPTAASGVIQTTVPVHGDLIVFAPGSCGASTATGHVAVVDTVDVARSQVTFVEENGANRRSSAQSCAKCFLHVVANTGTVSPPDGGVVSTGGTSGTPSTGGASGSGGRSASGGLSGSGGAPASGGAPGSGGSTGPGGAPGSGGAAVVGTGGAIVVATGGTVASTGGAPGQTGGATGSPHEGAAAGADVSGGCACSTSGSTPAGGFLATLLTAFGFAPLWRRRSRRQRNARR